MKLKYDNLEDAKTKLVGTFGYWNGKASIIKYVTEENPGDLWARGVGMSTGREFIAQIDDPKFNCLKYNIGYMNCMSRAAWFYRVPLKQYRQGLRSDQVKMRYSRREFSDIMFSPGKSLCAMMENNYPDFDLATELVRSREANISAFHKDFALTYDPIHRDCLVEYKGVNIGFAPNKKEFKLMDEYEHLLEALKEAVE